MKYFMAELLACLQPVGLLLLVAPLDTDGAVFQDLRNNLVRTL